MERSCLLSSLSNLTFSIQAQFCFTDRTIHEFLASKNMTETLNASQIKEFISDRVASSIKAFISSVHCRTFRQENQDVSLRIIPRLCFGVCRYSQN